MFYLLKDTFSDACIAIYKDAMQAAKECLTLNQDYGYNRYTVEEC